MNWTPGPWKVNDFGFVHADKVLISVPPGEEADVSFACYPGSEQFKANARLISLAPELAEALKVLVEIGELRRLVAHSTLEDARALLAKLQGGGKA